MYTTNENQMHRNEALLLLFRQE